MAPMEASAYLPPLEECLEGGKQILSFAHACTALAQDGSTDAHTGLSRFFEDTRTIETLRHSLEVQSQAKADSRSEFDTYTAAINISPNGRGDYNLKEIKDDALWLSQQLRIGEVTALRIAILEWQSRSEYSLKERIALDPSVGLSATTRLRSSLLRSTGHAASLLNGNDDAFETQPARRLRILKTWCRERQFQFKCLENVVVKTLEDSENDSDSEPSGKDSASTQSSPQWKRLGRTILKSWNASGPKSTTRQSWLLDTLKFLRHTTGQLSSGSGILQDDTAFDEFQLLWCETKGVELTFALHLILVNLQASTKLSSPSEVSGWFHYMRDVNFFENFEIPFLGTDSALGYFMCSLSTLTSLALLNVPLALETIDELSIVTVAEDDEERRSYLHSAKAIEEATTVISIAVENGIASSQPIGLAWSVILQEARERTQESQDTRDFRLSQRAYDSLGQSAISDSESSESATHRRGPSPHRRSSMSSDISQQRSLLEVNIDNLIARFTPPDDLPPGVAREDVISSIARTSLHGVGAFGGLANLATRFCSLFGADRSDQAEPRIRSLLLQILAATLHYVQYGNDVVSTTLAILSVDEDFVANTDKQWHSLEASPVATAFLRNRQLVELVFDNASARFPFESSPFLELCLALAHARTPDTEEFFVIEYFRELQTYTTTLSEQDAKYDLLEDDPYYVELQSTLDVSVSYGVLRQGLQLALPSNVPFQPSVPNIMLATIPEGTRGLILSDTKPMVVRFDFKQPGFGYLGRMVQQAAITYSSPEKWNLEVVLEPAVKTIALLTKLLKQAASELPNLPEGHWSGEAILEAFSENLDHHVDIVSVILEIFEHELYEQHTVVGGAQTEVLAQCMQFLHALLPTQPARVWPFLGRSSLLGLEGMESRFLGIVARQEMPVGRYPFLISSLQFFGGMIDDVVSRSVSKNAPSSALTRFEAQVITNSSSGIKETYVAKILYHSTKLMVDVFESAGKWKSTSTEDKMFIHSLLCSAMRKTLSYCFETDDQHPLGEKLTSTLAPSATHLLDVFLSSSKSEIPIEPFISNIHESLRTPNAPLLGHPAKLLTAQTKATLDLAETIVRVNAYLNQPPCRLEEQLFVCAEVLARCFAVNRHYQEPVVRLFHAMITGCGQTMDQPPSLLGYLGQRPAKWFLDLLMLLDEPLSDTNYVVSVWNFLSAIVSQRQQWFAIYLLTGKTARNSLLEKDHPPTPGKSARSFLDVAIAKLTQLRSLDLAVATSILEFVSSAADYWLWVPKRLEQNSEFIKELTRFINDLPGETSKRTTTTDEADALKVQMSASIANIFAMIVHRQNEVKDTSFAKQISPNLNYFVKEGVSPTTYNLSLHRSLQKNFDAKYPRCNISNFKRTILRTAPLGRSFFYDLELANKILSFDRAWDRQDGKGFLQEFERANLNLSLVQAQINLFHAWKSLAVEMALALSNEKTVQAYIAKVICACLESNQEAVLPEGIFGKLAQARADLSFVLLQKLIEVARTGKDARSVLTPAWRTLRGHAPDLGLALTSIDANYDRTLIKIVYLALQAYLPGAQDPIEQSKAAQGILTGPALYSVVLDILGTCVAQGFRSIVSTLHEDPTKVVPTDLALLNAILRTCLRIPNIERQTEQLTGLFADSQAARYASTLFSWADQLTIHGDPIYGELSMMFLVELSSVPALAESIVLGGILSQISASSLMELLTRAGGSGPFDQPARVHVIWSRCILPLMINLLRAIGAPIAGDVATFLDQFQTQLERASQCLDPSPGRPVSGVRTGAVTINTASEVHSLAIISSILDIFREAGPSAGIVPNEIPRLALDIGVLRSDLETRMQRRNALREDIVALDEREEAWSREKPTKVTLNCENLLEQKVVEELKGALAMLDEQD